MGEGSTRALKHSKNKEAFEAVQKAMADENVVAVVGPDAGARWYPTERETFEDIIREAKRVGKIDEGTFAGLRRNLASDIGAAARRLEAIYGKRRLRSRVADAFTRRRGPDGRFFSPAQEFLLRLPFRGYYNVALDLGVEEARLAVDQDQSDTGFSVGPTVETLTPWLDKAVWSKGSRALIYAHGHPSDPASVRITREGLRELYGAGPLRRIFADLWNEHPLVFVGVPSDDPFFSVIAELKLAEGSTRRHAALVGVPAEGEESGQDVRERLAEIGVDAVVFPMGAESDPDTLADLLKELNPPRGPAKELQAPAPEAPPDGLKGRLWHRTTEDDNFSGREDVLARLAAYSRDTEVRSLALIGPGGIGKTALTGHWLKRAGGAAQRAYDGVFYWSFNEDRSSTRFFAGLQRFLARELGAQQSHDTKRLTEAVAEMLREKAVLLFLDGLDTLQEGPRGSGGTGAILDGDIRELIRRLGEENAGLLFIVSRFPLVDLARHLGGGFRSIRLTAMSDEEGATLLEETGVDGTDNMLKDATRKLDGHPLALRLLARITGRREAGGFGDHLGRVFHAAQIKMDEPLEARIKALLRYFEKLLPPDDSAAVGLVALFSAAVPLQTVVDLSRELNIYGSKSSLVRKDKIVENYKRLSDEGLLVEEPGGRGYSAHPVLRENFRLRVLRYAKQVAQYLGASRKAEEMKDVESARPIMEAISILCDAGEYEHAFALYDQRLRNGELFLKWNAPKFGLDCTLNFVGDARRRFACSRALSNNDNALLLRRAASFALSCGETSLGAEYNDLHVDLCVKADNPAMLSSALVQKGVEALEFESTNDARAYGKRAHTVSERVAAPATGINALSLLGEANFYAGKLEDTWPPLDEAIDGFVRLSRALNLADLRVGFVYARILWTIGEMEAASDLFAALKEAVRNSRRGTGGPALEAQAADCSADAEERIAAYDSYADAMRRGDHVLGLMPALTGLARAYMDAGRAEEASEAAQEAADLAAPRAFTRRLAEALATRATARLAAGDHQDAIDDAELAIVRADECEHAWIRRDAYLVEARAYEGLGDAKGHREAQERASELEKTLVIPDDIRAQLIKPWWRETR